MDELGMHPGVTQLACLQNRLGTQNVLIHRDTDRGFCETRAFARVAGQCETASLARRSAGGELPAGGAGLLHLQPDRGHQLGIICRCPLPALQSPRQEPWICRCSDSGQLTTLCVSRAQPDAMSLSVRQRTEFWISAPRGRVLICWGGQHLPGWGIPALTSN